jgi:hypothetical protein
MTQEELHMQMLKTMVAEIERLEDLCSRAADALEDKQWEPFDKRDYELLNELRKSAQKVGP